MNVEEHFKNADEINLPLIKHTAGLTGIETDLEPQTREKIRDIRRSTAARNIYLLEELGKILKALDNAGIRPVLLKGAVLQNIYPPGVRFFRDMDILVRKDEIDRTVGELEKLGYSRQTPLLRKGAERFQGSLSYLKQGAIPVLVEPHWTLGLLHPYSGRIPTGELWNRAQHATISGAETLGLSPEDSLIHLCLHLLQHNHQGWIHPACDIVALVHHHGDEFDWELFVNRVVDYDLCLPVEFSLLKTIDLFKIDIPSFVFERLGNYSPGKLEKLRFATYAKLTGEEYRYSKALAMILSIPPSLVPFYMFCHLFPDREFLVHRYPHLGSRSLFFCHMYRIVDMFTKVSREIIRIIK